MEAKHWFGIVALGAVLLGGSFAFNDYRKPGDIPGARPLTAGLVDEKPQIDKFEIDISTPAPVPAPTPKPTPTPATPQKPTPPTPEPANSGGGDPSPTSSGPVRTVDGACIAGVVKWGEKKAPRLSKIDTSSNPYCAAQHGSAPLLAEKNGIVDANMNLAGVIVYIKNVPSGTYDAREEDVVLDQVGCRYVPHVVAFQIGQNVIIRSSDDTMHNVHWTSRLNGDWNVTQPNKGDIGPPAPFRRPEIGTCVFKCDIHPWMQAKVGVFDHPFFAVSRADGTFEIPAGLPDGKYELWAWHEKYKTAKIKGLEVKGGACTSVEFTFKKNKKNTGKVIKKTTGKVK